MRHCMRLRYKWRWGERWNAIVIVLIMMRRPCIHSAVSPKVLASQSPPSSSSASSSSPSSSSSVSHLRPSVQVTETIESILQTIGSSFQSHRLRLIHQRRPFVTLSYAQSLDGKIAVSDKAQRCSSSEEGEESASRHQQCSDEHSSSSLEKKASESLHTSLSTTPLPPPSSSSNFAISGQESLLMTHGLRHVHDAVLIGGRTLFIDNPRLDNRLWKKAGGDNDGDHLGDRHQPRPVILDPDLKYIRRLGSSLRIAYPETLIVCCHEDVMLKINKRNNSTHNSHDYDDNEYQMRDQKDKYDLTCLLSDITNSTTVTIIPCKGSYSGSDSHHLDIHDVLRRLYDQCNITSVMVEGGASILSSFVSADVVDCYCVTIAPVLLGGNGLDAFTFTRVSTKSMIDDGIDVATELGRHVQFIPLGNDCIFLGSG